jgi:hypothetical protein
MMLQMQYLSFVVLEFFEGLNGGFSAEEVHQRVTVSVDQKVRWIFQKVIKVF